MIRNNQEVFYYEKIFLTFLSSWVLVHQHNFHHLIRIRSRFTGFYLSLYDHHPVQRMHHFNLRWYCNAIRSSTRTGRSNQMQNRVNSSEKVWK
nr:MAG TPA: hypothetical protein [Caudoviricetes sp.]